MKILLQPMAPPGMNQVTKHKVPKEPKPRFHLVLVICYLVLVEICSFRFGAYTATAIRDWTGPGPLASDVHVTVAVFGSSATALYARTPKV